MESQETMAKTSVIWKTDREFKSEYTNKNEKKDKRIEKWARHLTDTLERGTAGNLI